MKNKSTGNVLYGIATLTVSLPEDAKVGDYHVFETELCDDYIVPKFESKFYVKVKPEEEVRLGKSGKPHKPVDESKKGNHSHPNSFAMPEIIPVKKMSGKNTVWIDSLLWYIAQQRKVETTS